MDPCVSIRNTNCSKLYDFSPRTLSNTKICVEKAPWNSNPEKHFVEGLLSGYLLYNINPSTLQIVEKTSKTEPRNLQNHGKFEETSKNEPQNLHNRRIFEETPKTEPQNLRNHGIIEETPKTEPQNSETD